MSSEREGGENEKEVSGRQESDANRWGETIALPEDRGWVGPVYGCGEGEGDGRAIERESPGDPGGTNRSLVRSRPGQSSDASWSGRRLDGKFSFLAR